MTNSTRLTVFYQTDIATAEQIIANQRIVPRNGGLYGPGVYFGSTIDSATNPNLQGVFLVADVYTGRQKHVTPEEVVAGLNLNQIQAEGHDSIIGPRLPGGREIIIFDPDRVKNIKYAFGNRPNAIFTTNRNRICLFYATDTESAQNICQEQKIPRLNRPIGRGCYMFDSIADAIQINPENTNTETYLAADVFIKNIHRLANNETADSRASVNYNSFIGYENGISVYLLKDPRSIANIHFCGGQSW